MTDSPHGPSPADLSDPLSLAFAPIHKRALGVAVGTVAAVVLFGVTAWSILLDVARDPLERLQFFLPGYSVTWGGAVIGAVSGGFAFFVAAWFLAFCRNLTLAVSVWVVRTRAELRQTRDFLDHI